ncbi:hypothetical protein CAEBREN_21578 [Caenorhabditis brenneri]|uniref:Uncharacterized protein n=1 Tax=Caenorhabditis brenneri TaxID=135651 RepID=G0MMN7_CAEBE|nr:hypothetical protein CAEBREN_21578 [Caenorhabditis brenneri]
MLLSFPEEVTRIVDGIPVVQNSCRPKYGLVEAGRQIVLLHIKMRRRMMIHKGKAKKAVRDFPLNKMIVDERTKELAGSGDDIEDNEANGPSMNEGK